MINLLKVDLYRILKSRLLIIVLILIVVLPFLTVGLIAALSAITKAIPADLIDGADEISDGLSGLFNARSLIYTTYNLSDNIGLVIPIFSGIYVYSDVNSGMVRNKIIQGHSRLKIYLSHLLTSIIFNVVTITLYFLIYALFARMFFPYGVEFKGEEVKMMFFFVILGTLTFAFIASVTTVFALNFKSMAPLIIFTIVLTLGLGILTQIFNFVDYSSYEKIVYMIPSFALTLPSTTMYGGSGGLTFEPFIFGLIGTLLFMIACSVSGFILFDKKDLK